MDIQKIQGTELTIPVLPITVLPSTMLSITSISKADSFDLKEIAHSFVENGKVNFPSLFSIPASNRIEALEKIIGKRQLHALVTVLVKKFQDNYNVPAKMNGTQIVEVAYDLILKGREYHCALEDFIVFFERAKTGEYGKVYTRIDGPILLELFERYLDSRHEVIAEIRKGNELSYRSQVREEGKDVGRVMAGFGGAIGELVSKMKELPYHPNSKLEENEIRHPHKSLNPKQ